MNWQDVLALAAVAFAAIYLLRGMLRKRPADAPSCGSSCGGCSAKDSAQPTVVSLTPEFRPKQGA